MVTTLPEVDIGKAQALAMKLLSDTTATSMGTLHLIGQRLGLFETLAAAGSVTAGAFAQKAGIQERYALEWLSAMACDGYVTYDDQDQTFSMTPEQVVCLVTPDHPLSARGFVRMYPDLWSNVDRLQEAFVNGGGVHQHEFGEEWMCGLERITGPAFVNNLTRDWIPAMPGVDARLRAGGSVADVGCGNGQALIQVALAYPDAQLYGFDINEPAIAAARANAEAAGVADRIRFEVIDASVGLPGTYDLILCCDVVHDLPFPHDTLVAIRKAVAPGGRFFVLEFNFSSDLQENIDHPMGLGAFGYSASVNYCMTMALAVGGIGTGTCMGERKFRELAAAAGFGQVRRLDFPGNPLNVFFEVKAA